MQSGRAAQAQGQLGEAISLPNWEVWGETARLGAGDLQAQSPCLG